MTHRSPAQFTVGRCSAGKQSNYQCLTEDQCTRPPNTASSIRRCPTWACLKPKPLPNDPQTVGIVSVACSSAPQARSRPFSFDKHVFSWTEALGLDVGLTGSTESLGPAVHQVSDVVHRRCRIALTDRAKFPLEWATAPHSSCKSVGLSSSSSCLPGQAKPEASTLLFAQSAERCSWRKSPPVAGRISRLRGGLPTAPLRHDTLSPMIVCWKTVQSCQYAVILFVILNVVPRRQDCTVLLETGDISNC